MIIIKAQYFKPKLMIDELIHTDVLTVSVPSLSGSSVSYTINYQSVGIPVIQEIDGIDD